MKSKSLPFLVITILALGPGFFPVAAAATSVSIVSEDLSPPVRHGLNQVEAALEQKGIAVSRATTPGSAPTETVLVAGLAGKNDQVATLLQSVNVSPPTEAESLLIEKLDVGEKKVLLVTGADDRGLMYALLDTAERIGWSTNPDDPFMEVRETREKPYVTERAVSIYTMHRRHFESRFFDETHWARYLDMLAANRFNSFVLIFGYENAGYFAPAYPYFFDVEEFPGVKVVGFSEQDQQRHFQALKRLIRMVHERGLIFKVGLWDHIYRGGVQSGGMDVDPGDLVPGVVVGLDQENLVSYSQAALREFLELFPEVDGIQFRMHGESGLKRDEMHDFWKSIYEIMNEHAPHMLFDARAKEFPDSLIELAVDMGVNIRICTKYWAEQMGLPFHPTHIPPQNQFDRRHGYADLLRYPKTYDMHWRLWNGGTTRVLLWGDPEWVRRFTESTHLYHGEGFEVNEMLATKMASQPHDLKPFELLDPEYRYYDYEFERYWHFFQLFGRLGYNPDTPSEIWKREFESRFGKRAAPDIERALHRASWILPMINAYNFPYGQFPTTRGWPAKERRQDLPEYAKALGSDTEQFLSMPDAARLIVEGGHSAKIRPQESSRWFSDVADEILENVKQAEKAIGAHRSNEFISTVTDLRILANLARYHARRAHAGLSWALWEKTRDLNAMDDAIRHEEEAIEAWDQIVKAAGDVYNDNLRMGLDRAGLSGHWKDELRALQEGLEKLRQERSEFKTDKEQVIPQIAHVPARKTGPGEDLVLRATVTGRHPVSEIRIAYAAKADTTGSSGSDGYLEYQFERMERAGRYLYRGVIPGSQVKEGLRYFIEAVDTAGHWVRYPETGRVHPISVLVTDDDEAPTVEHQPIASARPEEPLEIRLRASDPAGIKWVRLRYRPVNQHYDYQTLPMRPAGQDGKYEAVVPGEHVPSRWDFMYFIEVMDHAGNGKIYPDLHERTPYVVVKLER